MKIYHLVPKKFSTSSGQHSACLQPIFLSKSVCNVIWKVFHYQHGNESMTTEAFGGKTNIFHSIFSHRNKAAKQDQIANVENNVRKLLLFPTLRLSRHLHACSLLFSCHGPLVKPYHEEESKFRENSAKSVPVGQTVHKEGWKHSSIVFNINDSNDQKFLRGVIPDRHWRRRRFQIGGEQISDQNLPKTLWHQYNQKTCAQKIVFPEVRGSAKIRPDVLG